MSKHLLSWEIYFLKYVFIHLSCLKIVLHRMHTFFVICIILWWKLFLIILSRKYDLCRVWGNNFSVPQNTDETLYRKFSARFFFFFFFLSFFYLSHHNVITQINYLLSKIAKYALAWNKMPNLFNNHCFSKYLSMYPVWYCFNIIYLEEQVS